MASSKEKIKVSVGILTLNSAKELPKTLETLKRFDDVYICDGNSIDGTQDIARSFGARVTKQKETDEPNQRITNFGEARTTCLLAGKYDWHVRVDSDEYLSPEVVEEIAKIVDNPNPPHLIYKMPRKYVWRGNVIDDTITYPNRQIRFFNRKAVPRYTKITHEKVFINHGYDVGFLKGVMYVPLADTYAAWDTRTLKRALDWDRRQYEAFMTPYKWAEAVLHTGALLTLYVFRFLRVRLISRGNKFPISYELWRFKYQILALGLATKIFFGKLIK
jgi:(heptosyl)LPS beta-1,4-glucosyltransferase